MRANAKILVAAMVAASGASNAARQRSAIETTYLYSLDDGAAKRALGWAALNWDASASELFVVSGGVVDIFNDNGIFTYSFEENAFGIPMDVAAMPDGDLYVLAALEGRTRLFRCNFRGEPLAALELKGLPADFAERFAPSALAVREGRLYLADRNALMVAVVTADGAVARTYDLAQMIGLGPRDRAEAMMRGFSVDRKGNLLFTVASVFSAYVVTPEGKVRMFGSRGSSPGKFNVVAGIAADDEGHLFITDSLRAVVMVFDGGFRFLGEFGYRGDGPENLISPYSVAVGNGRIYVSQSRGAVKAFAVRFD